MFVQAGSMIRRQLILGVILIQLFAGSCAIQDTDGIIMRVRITFDSSGLTTWIMLSNAVEVPLDKDGATLIMVESSCGCFGDLQQRGEYWEYRDEKSPGCFIRIHIFTGNVECSS